LGRMRETARHLSMIPVVLCFHSQSGASPLWGL
jgi:hypothetical protein